MKILKRVRLENFQSHSDTSIDFDEGLNIIVGSSDHGKSAIIRGIKWALYNEPSGDFFIKEGEKDVKVTLEFSDNMKLIRYRSPSKNQYILVYPNGEESIYQGFGVNVPDEIQEAINIHKIELDGDESNAINLGEQLEGPFLLSEKTSTRASAIGRLIGVDVIDDALRETLRDNRNLGISKNKVKEDSENLKKDLKEFENLEELEKKLSLLNKYIEKLESKIILFQKLESLNKMYNTIVLEKKKMKNILSKTEELKDLEIIIKDIENKFINWINLNRLSQRYINTNKNINKGKEVISKLDNIDETVEYIDIINEKNKLYKELDIINKSYLSIDKSMDKGKKIMQQLEDISKVESIFSELSSKLNRTLILNNINKSYLLNQRNLNVGRNYINKFNDLEYAVEFYSNLNLYLIKLNKLESINLRLENIKKQLKLEEKEKSNIENYIEINVKKYEEILLKFEVCPLCFSNIDEEHIDKITKEYIGGSK